MIEEGQSQTGLTQPTATWIVEHTVWYQSIETASRDADLFRGVAESRAGESMFMCGMPKEVSDLVDKNLRGLLCRIVP